MTLEDGGRYGMMIAILCCFSAITLLLLSLLLLDDNPLALDSFLLRMLWCWYRFNGDSGDGKLLPKAKRRVIKIAIERHDINSKYQFDLQFDFLLEVDFSTFSWLYNMMMILLRIWWWSSLVLFTTFCRVWKLEMIFYL